MTLQRQALSSQPTSLERTALANCLQKRSGSGVGRAVSSHNLTVALALADAGWRVLPLNAQKAPLIPHGFKQASTDPATITGWWVRWPLAIPALATHNIVVLDIDRACQGTREGATAALAPDGLGWLLDDAGLLVTTPGGGMHAWFAAVPGVACPPRTSDIADKIDSRGCGADGEARSYIIAPDALRPDGRQYRIIEGDLTELQQPSRRLLGLLHFNKRERTTISTSASLKAAIRAAAPDCWRTIFDDHVTAELTRHPRPVSGKADDAMRRQALHDLNEAAEHVASLIDGRKRALFTAAARLGKYSANGVVSEPEISAALMGAWATSGALTKHGAKCGLKQIADGLKVSTSAPLPPLANRFRVALRVPNHNAPHEASP